MTIDPFDKLRTGLKGPYPYFGGKRLAAPLVWPRFGQVKNYVEPFFGGGAMLLRRPDEPGIETINDRDCYVSNFWRAVKWDPEGVARWADWPINEADLHARHLWLIQQDQFRERMLTDPEYFDSKIAGWWVWGICTWIGGGWCRIREDKSPSRQKPALSGEGQGIHRPGRKKPAIGSSGHGVHRTTLTDLREYIEQLSHRLRRVRVCCGDWGRVVTRSVTYEHGLTAVFLDPPYAKEAKRDPNLYAVEDLEVAHQVREWAIANGDNPLLRIALCGYEEEHAPYMPKEWICVPWKAGGGYSNKGSRRPEGVRPLNQNRFRERIWFSPHCLEPNGLSNHDLRQHQHNRPAPGRTGTLPAQWRGQAGRA